MTNYEKIKAMSIEEMAEELCWGAALYINYVCKSLFGIEQVADGKFVEEILPKMIEHLEREAKEDG